MPPTTEETTEPRSAIIRLRIDGVGLTLEDCKAKLDMYFEQICGLSPRHLVKTHELYERDTEISVRSIRAYKGRIVLEGRS